MLRIIHYHNKCIGCHACVTAAPFRWVISRRDGKSRLIGSKEKKGVMCLVVDREEECGVTEAMNQCPVRVIRMERVVDKKRRKQ